jgi:heat-inducible transcriptional repressor
MHLADREIDILTTIVDIYIHTAQPVGSRTVSKASPLGLSPASIRNIMADLTDKGYLEQPHTSAGRIPSVSGFRFYLDSILHLAPLSREEKERIRTDLSDDRAELPDIFRQGSRLLSSLSNQVSIILAPRQELVKWQQIDFILLRPGLVMAVLVMQGGILHNKVVSTDSSITSEDLIRYGNYLNHLFQGRTIPEARSMIVREMERARDAFDALYGRALELAEQTFASTGSPELFIDGAKHILDQPEFADLDTMRALLNLIEERSRLLDLLDRTAELNTPKISLGREEKWPELSDCCLISSPYRTSDNALGVVGVIGPMRMNYSKVVPLVDFTAHVLSQFLMSRF